MDKNFKTPRLDLPGPSRCVEVKVKDENLRRKEYFMAKERLKGMLKQLSEQADAQSEETRSSSSHKGKKSFKTYSKKHENPPIQSRYLMKVYDRSVDLVNFVEDTPLYPICRAWMANTGKKPQTIIKERLLSPKPESTCTSKVKEGIYELPSPSEAFVGRIPSPTLEQKNSSKDKINLNYDENPPLKKEELMKEHLKRWSNIKKKWISSSLKNEERYAMSKQVLESIYSKEQEKILDE